METVAPDTFFPTDKSSHGHTCSQLLVGTTSDRLSVYHLEKESQNCTALQYYSRPVVVPPVINTDNSQSELVKIWSYHCRQNYIEKTTI